MIMNLIIIIIKSLVKKKKDNSIQMEELGRMSDGKEKEYLDLVSKLCSRYIQMKKRNLEKNK